MSNTELRALRDEMGATNVKDIVYSPQKKVWTIQYKTKLNPDEFDTLLELLEFIRDESRD